MKASLENGSSALKQSSVADTGATPLPNMGKMACGSPATLKRHAPCGKAFGRTRLTQFANPNVVQDQSRALLSQSD